MLNVNSFAGRPFEVLPKCKMMGEKNQKYVNCKIIMLPFVFNSSILSNNVALPLGGAKVLTDPSVFSDLEGHH